MIAVMLLLTIKISHIHIMDSTRSIAQEVQKSPMNLLFFGSSLLIIELLLLLV
jgi:hypothetical protein